ncbi:sigma-70 family RNA polymerase sigma factor [Opitutus sp. ER46]|uniref:RNA polymerase sigma factor n=1 Tax=Opitutus sp. ER46 TaxID=2161864 RepID=UPI000D32069B|nr:sigma-70 family RNA polymerase sigma factor [Opitutus sp. ER46]PTX91828.1 RNA polymerase subunit sigma-24 [Opitutus sp. ER46]
MTASSSADDNPAAVPPDRGRFAATQWSMVLQAGRADSGDAQEALARLCETYWYPLYAHVRRRGYAAADAQDLTQEFFLRLLDRRLLAQADPQRGRFRSFVLTALDHFLADARAKAQAQKRGGGAAGLSLDFDFAERRFAIEPVDAAAPDKIFDWQWALALLEAVLRQLAAEYAAQGQERVYALLKDALIRGRDGLSYAEIGGKLGLSEGAVKVAAHRLRRRYREYLRAEIARTVAAEADVADEMRHLMRTFSGE